MKYNIALLALESQQFIQQAQQMFGAYHQGYILSPISHPHVTLCQFICAETQTLKSLKTAIQKITSTPPKIQFTGISFLQKDPKNPALYWVELSIAREDDLVAWHEMAVSIIETIGCTPLSQTGNLYRPHLTLAFTKLPKVLPIWSDTLFRSVEFKLTIGRGDDLGQYVEVIGI